MCFLTLCSDICSLLICQVACMPLWGYLFTSVLTDLTLTTRGRLVLISPAVEVDWPLVPIPPVGLVVMSHFVRCWIGSCQLSLGVVILLLASVLLADRFTACFFCRLLSFRIVGMCVVLGNVFTLLVCRPSVCRSSSGWSMLYPWLVDLGSPKYFTHVDWGPSRGSSVHRPRNEDPHQRERNFVSKFLTLLYFRVGKYNCQP